MLELFLWLAACGALLALRYVNLKGERVHAWLRVDRAPRGVASPNGRVARCFAVRGRADCYSALNLHRWKVTAARETGPLERVVAPADAPRLESRERA